MQLDTDGPVTRAREGTAIPANATGLVPLGERSSGEAAPIPLNAAGTAVSVTSGSSEAGALTAAAALNADGQAVAAVAGLRFHGFTVQETAGAAATAVIRHGTLVGDPPIAYINLAANQAAGDVFPVGIAAANGIFFDLTSGAMNCVVYHKTVT